MTQPAPLPHKGGDPTMATILIVDDEENVRNYIRRILTAANYQVYTARGGRLGVAMARLTRPDLILLDIRMPDINGIDVLTKLKASRRTASIPVVMLTGNTDDESKAAAMHEYAVRYLTKPIEPDTLVARVDEVLKLPRLSP